MSKLTINSLSVDEYRKLAYLKENQTFINALKKNVSMPDIPGIDLYFRNIGLTEYFGNNLHKQIFDVFIDFLGVCYVNLINEKDANIFGFTCHLITRNNFFNHHYIQMMEWIGGTIRAVLNTLKDKQSTNLLNASIIDECVPPGFYYMVFTQFKHVHDLFGAGVFNVVELNDLVKRYDKTCKPAGMLLNNDIPLTELPNLNLNPSSVLSSNLIKENSSMNHVQQQLFHNPNNPNDPLIEVMTNVGARLVPYSLFVANQQQQQPRQMTNAAYVQHNNFNAHAEPMAGDYRVQGAGKRSAVGWIDDGVEYPDNGVKQNIVNEVNYIPPSYSSPLPSQNNVDRQNLMSTAKVFTKYEEMKKLVHEKYWYDSYTVLAVATGIRPDKIKGGIKDRIWNRLDEIYCYDFSVSEDEPTIVFISREVANERMKLDDLSFRHPANPGKLYTPGFEEVDTTKQLKELTGLDYDTFMNNLVRDSKATVTEEVFDSDAAEGEEIKATGQDEIINLGLDNQTVNTDIAVARITAIQQLESMGHKPDKISISVAHEIELIYNDEDIEESDLEDISNLFQENKTLLEVSRALQYVHDLFPIQAKVLRERVVKETNFFLHKLVGINEKFYIKDYTRDVIEGKYIHKLAEHLQNNVMVKAYEKFIVKFVMREINHVIKQEDRIALFKKVLKSDFEGEENNVLLKRVIAIDRPTMLLNTSWSDAVIESLGVSSTDDTIFIMGKSNGRYYDIVKKTFEQKEIIEANKTLKVVPIVLYTKTGKQYRVDASPFGETFFITQMETGKQLVKNHNLF